MKPNLDVIIAKKELNYASGLNILQKSQKLT
jgi:hypothetical protein